MIWYVATLIASVISTRGLAAQGELKCSVPALPLLALSAPSSPPPAPRPRRAPRLSAGEAQAWAGRAPGHCREGRGTAGQRVRREGAPARGLLGTREKTPWDRGRLRPPLALGFHTSMRSPVPLIGATASSSVGESAALLTLGAGEFAGVGAGCSTLTPRAELLLRRPAFAGRCDPEPWDSRHPRLRDRALGLSAPTAPARAPPDHTS